MKQITSGEFDAEVLAGSQPVVVDFFTDGCPPCRALAPVLQEWEEESGGAFKVVKVNAAEEGALATSYGITAVPALFLFANGKCVGQTLGLRSKKNLKQWFDDSLRSETA